MIILLHKTYIYYYNARVPHIPERSHTRWRVFYAFDGYHAAQAIAIIYNNILRKRARKNKKKTAPSTAHVLYKCIYDNIIGTGPLRNDQAWKSNGARVILII